MCCHPARGAIRLLARQLRERDRSPTFKPRRLMTSEFTREDGSGANWALKPSLAILFEKRTAQTTELLENQRVHSRDAAASSTNEKRVRGRPSQLPLWSDSSCPSQRNTLVSCPAEVINSVPYCREYLKPKSGLNALENALLLTEAYKSVLV